MRRFSPRRWRRPTELGARARTAPEAVIRAVRSVDRAHPGAIESEPDAMTDETLFTTALEKADRARSPRPNRARSRDSCGTFGRSRAPGRDRIGARCDDR